MMDILIESLKPILYFLWKGHETSELLWIRIVLIFLVGIVVLVVVQKFMSESKKQNEERTAKKIENQNELEKIRGEYEGYIENIGCAVVEMQNASPTDTEEQTRNKIIGIRDLIFDKLLLSLEKYQKIYEIIYKRCGCKYYDLYKNEYKNLLLTITNLVETINDDKLLAKAKLEKYKIQPYTLNAIYNFTNSHFYFFDVLHKVENYRIKRKLLKVGK